MPTSAVPRGPQYRLRSADEVVAAIPYLLGFRPLDSLVVLGLVAVTGVVAITARIDLPRDATQARHGAEQLARALHSSRAQQALIVVFAAGDAEASNPDVDGVIRSVVRRLRRANVSVVSVLQLTNDDLRPVGVRPDAPVPALAVDAVVRGRRILADRDEVEALVRPSSSPDPAMVGAVERLVALDLPGADLARSFAMLCATLDPDGSTRAARATPTPGVGDLALCVVALDDVIVRDTLVAALCDVEGAPYDELLMEVCRRAPTSWVAPAATVLAVAAYLRGDGVLARCALDRALAVDPTYSLAGLVEVALDHALPPAKLRAALGDASASQRARPAAVGSDGAGGVR